MDDNSYEKRAEENAGDRAYGVALAVLALTVETRRAADALERIATALEMSYKHGVAVHQAED